MPRYEFRCECGERTILNIPLSEYYIPRCNHCDKEMQRHYSKPLIVPGCLDGGNIAK